MSVESIVQDVVTKDTVIKSRSELLSFGGKHESALIIGYGKAGKRHARILVERGIRIDIVEPDPKQTDNDNIIIADDTIEIYTNLEDALRVNMWDIAVICTPPSLHLPQMQLCLDAGMYIMCEKPLCDIGQLSQAKQIAERNGAGRVAVAYNYRYNPDIFPADFDSHRQGNNNEWHLNAVQYREKLPTWGLLLDHVSHDVDIIRWISGKEIQEVLGSVFVDNERFTGWGIDGVLSNEEPFFIRESVEKTPCERGATISLSDRKIVSITANPNMYINMWSAFLYNIEKGIRQFPSIKDAVKTQTVLESAYYMEQMKK